MVFCVSGFIMLQWPSRLGVGLLRPCDDGNDSDAGGTDGTNTDGAVADLRRRPCGGAAGERSTFPDDGGGAPFVDGTMALVVESSDDDMETGVSLVLSEAVDRA